LDSLDGQVRLVREPLTIVHHCGNGGICPKMFALAAYTKIEHARSTSASSIALHTALRRDSASRARPRCGTGYLPSAGRRAQARAALRVLVGLDGPPFGLPPRQAVPVPRTKEIEMRGPVVSILIVNWVSILIVNWNTRERVCGISLPC
jgi:hypothetical protein